MLHFTPTIKSDMRFLFLLLCAVVVGAGISCITVDEVPWLLSKEQNGIKIYTRERAGSVIKEFKGVMTIQSDIAKVETYLSRPDKYSEWQNGINTSTILKKVSDSAMYVQFLTELPWPLTNRDVVCYMTKRKTNGGGLRYDFKGQNNFIPNTADHIRMNNVSGYWELTPVAGGKVRVVQSFFGDPAGSLPTWVINMFIVDGPLKTFTNLKNKCE